MEAGSSGTSTTASSLAVTLEAPGIGSPLAAAGVPVTVPTLVVSTEIAAVLVSVADSPGARMPLTVPMVPSLSSSTMTFLR